MPDVAPFVSLAAATDFSHLTGLRQDRVEDSCGTVLGNHSGIPNSSFSAHIRPNFAMLTIRTGPPESEPGSCKLLQPAEWQARPSRLPTATDSALALLSMAGNMSRATRSAVECRCFVDS